MLFLRANGQNPELMGYRPEDVEAFPGRLAKTKLRLDPDEYGHSIFLAKSFGLRTDGGESRLHAEGVHLHPTTDPDRIPEQFRAGIMDIIGKYTNGRWKLVGSDWQIDGGMPPLKLQ
jgi:hypothetical protein